MEPMYRVVGLSERLSGRETSFFFFTRDRMWRSLEHTVVHSYIFCNKAIETEKGFAPIENSGMTAGRFVFVLSLFFSRKKIFLMCTSKTKKSRARKLNY